ncbi:MAG: leucyl/phenylalanyl-tRNA--protein transferase [Armatimonadetes bacterium]|nr:leucyl/phenylalanyl-tRNA--protein transferase [Armatimonadota bacterium]
MLSPELLSQGYEAGIFPMADRLGRIEWYAVSRRALFPLSGVGMSRSLLKVIRQAKYEVKFDTDFEGVMRGCFRPGDNWLTEEFVSAYTACHQQGWAHCSEAWYEGKLVGGVYGLAVGGCFCAESMFFRERDASKVALAALVEECRMLGFTLFDAQIMNPHLRSLGAFEVELAEYESRLRGALTVVTPWSLGRP